MGKIEDLLERPEIHIDQDDMNRNLSGKVIMVQYSLGRWIGYRFPASSHGSDYQDILINPAAAHYSIHQKSRITAGQAFGQKNTALGVWMAQMYLNPLSSIGPAAYIIWQNLLNSYQLWRAGKSV